MITAAQVRERMFRDIFDQRLMDNSFRGIWCEYMVAEALGSACRTVGVGWHAWDLEIGESRNAFPERIRIQLKNSARLQSWNAKSGTVSSCEFHLKYRNRPYYFEQSNPGVPCEAFGFLCELYILCLHDEANPERANHADLDQWKFFLVPVVGPICAVTSAELGDARQKTSRHQQARKLDETPRNP